MVCTFNCFGLHIGMTFPATFGTDRPDLARQFDVERVQSRHDQIGDAKIDITIEGVDGYLALVMIHFPSEDYHHVVAEFSRLLGAPPSLQSDAEDDLTSGWQTDQGVFHVRQRGASRARGLASIAAENWTQRQARDVSTA